MPAAHFTGRIKEHKFTLLSIQIKKVLHFNRFSNIIYNSPFVRGFF